MESYGGIILTGKAEELEEKPVPVPLCPPQKPTWIDLGANPVLRGERSATNDLSHGTAQITIFTTSFSISFVISNIWLVKINSVKILIPEEVS
jgi:hypothetical protein